MSAVQRQRRTARRVNIPLKLTPSQTQHAIDPLEEGKRLLKRLGSKAPEFTLTDVGILLDFLPDDVIDMNEPEDDSSPSA